MTRYIYYIILALFILGSTLISVINTKKSAEIKKENWKKFISYFLITNLIIISIITETRYFFYLTIIISGFGVFEIGKSIFVSRKILTGVIVLIVFLPLVWFFIQFSKLNQNLLLFTYLTVIIFDAFSQLTGQLFGKTKLIPRISPNKTVEGLAGGLILTGLLSMLFIGLLQTSIVKTIFFSFIISVFALSGDLLASYAKRQFNIKDFSKLLPGQGGFLDRFDSFIFSSVIVTILNHYDFL